VIIKPLDKLRAIERLSRQMGYDAVKEIDVNLKIQAERSDQEIIEGLGESFIEIEAETESAS